jgi:hypothetical protein
MKLRTPLLAAVSATMLLAALVSSASARNFSVSNQNIRASFSSVEFFLPGNTTRCRVTLEGSLHERTIIKRIALRIGHITSAILGPCSSGTATILRETLPWNVNYSGFEGALPNIRSIRTHIVHASWRVREAEGINCLVRSTEGEPVVATFHRNTTTQKLSEVGISGSIRTGENECFGIQGSFSSDSGRVSQSGANHTAVFVSLI